MNVTQKGYYTQDYLENGKNRSSRHYDRRRKDQGAEFTTSSVTTPKSMPPAPQIRQSQTFKSPSTMNTASEGFPVFPESPETNFTAEESIATHNIPLDPDELHQEITPAQLNVLQRQKPALKSPKSRGRRYSYYDDESLYDDYEESQYDDDSTLNHYRSGGRRYDDYYSKRTPKKSPKSVRFKPEPVADNYYIKEQQRYQEAKYVKPKIYTHKTFKKVFQEEDVKQGMYNPIDSVFDDPVEIKEQEEKQKIKKAFKNIQLIMGKEDYRNYDYYEHKSKHPATEIFTSNVSDSSDDEELEGQQEKTDGNEEKKKTTFKKMWKKQTRKIKKELGQDYMKNLEKQWEAEDLKKQIKEEEMAEEQRMKELESEEPPQPIVEEPPESLKQGFYAGPNPNFHPAWNYMLSWLSYEQPKVVPATESQKAISFDSTEEESVQVQEAPVAAKSMKTIAAKLSAAKLAKPKGKKPIKTIKISGRQLKNFNRNVNKLKNMWNLPASNLFMAENAQLMQAQNALSEVETIAQSLPQSSIYDGSFNDSSEVIVEVDSDDETVATELYFNPVTGQLEKEPPTSYSSMEYDKSLSNTGTRNLTGSKFKIDTSNGAKAILSNINSLIKSVKVLKIIFAPIDVIAESFPTMQTVVILIELVIFMWMLYELSLLIDALCMMVKAVCAPMIAMGRFMNRIM